MKNSMSAVIQSFRNLRIKQKLFMLLVFIMAIFIALTYTALQYAYSIYDHQLYLRSSQVLNLSSNSIESELRRIESTTFNIVTDPTLQSKLTTIKSDPTEQNYERFQIRDEIVTRLVQFAGAEKYVISADMFDLSGYIYSAGRVPGWSEEQKMQIWDVAKKGEGQLRWIYAKTPETSLTAVRLVRSYYSYLNLDLETIGVLVLRIRMDQVVEDVSRGTELGRGELLIMAGEQRVYPSSLAPDSLDGLAAAPVASGYEVRDDGKHKVFVSQMKSGYTDWTYSSIIPFDSIFRGINWMKNMLIVVFSVALLLMTILAMRVARGITGPIEKLINMMKQVQKGDFNTVTLPSPDSAIPLPKDEIGQLHRTYRMMVQQINELITENYAKQLTIKETQFKALQAQINPHFLYNTLESINWEAKMGGQVRISRMVESLGFLLRSSISQKESIVTLSQELDIIRHYLTIQQTRFEERLVFQLEVAAHLYTCPIPKLSLQPLVENAIHHALEPKVEPCHISIRSVEQADRVLIIVEDDGPGMPPALLDQVRRGEVHSKGNGIGLSNIRERIVLAFGDEYGLEIESQPDQGTQVTVQIPYERGDSYV
ncbi:MAG: sensor histidine kinase [Paenibacillaceae bacterium]|nr:sensor histidine kinase [Paenibacillaceae bacterium]